MDRQTLIVHVNDLNELLDIIVVLSKTTHSTARVYVLILDRLIGLESSLQSLLQNFSKDIEKSKKNIDDHIFNDFLDYVRDNKNIRDHFYKLECIYDYLMVNKKFRLLSLEINHYFNMFEF